MVLIWVKAFDTCKKTPCQTRAPKFRLCCIGALIPTILSFGLSFHFDVWMQKVAKKYKHLKFQIFFEKLKNYHNKDEHLK